MQTVWFYLVYYPPEAFVGALEARELRPVIIQSCSDLNDRPELLGHMVAYPKVCETQLPQPELAHHLLVAAQVRGGHLLLLDQLEMELAAVHGVEVNRQLRSIHTDVPAPADWEL